MPHFHTNSPTVAGSVLLCSNTHSLFGNLGQMCLCSDCSPLLWMPPVLWQPSPALTPRGPPRPGEGGLLSPRRHAGRHALAWEGGGSRSGAPRPPQPVLYFAPFAMSDRAPIASKTWRAPSVAMFPSAARAGWKVHLFCSCCYHFEWGRQCRLEPRRGIVPAAEADVTMLGCSGSQRDLQKKFTLVIEPMPEKNEEEEMNILF